MSSPNHPTLQQLRDLDRSLPGFHDRLNDFLHKEVYQRWVYGENYQQRVVNLQGDDLAWLVDYLDKARSVLPFPSLDSLPRRLSTSMVSNLLVLPSGSIYVSSKRYVEQVGYSHRRTRFHLPFSRLVPNRSPQVALATCMREPSMV